jgi:hypothetical protein
MPSYDYEVPQTGQVFSVEHSILKNPRTLGELIEVTGLKLDGQADLGAKIRRLPGGGIILTSRPVGQTSCCGVPGCERTGNHFEPKNEKH